MGTFQMAILLCFNNSNSLTVKDIQENTQLPEKELVKQVQSLLESKLIMIAESPENSATNEAKVNLIIKKKKEKLICNQKSNEFRT